MNVTRKIIHLLQMIQNTNKKVVFTRIACLGKDVLEIFYEGKVQLVNNQKGRIDFLVELIKHKSQNEINFEYLKKHINREDVYYLILEQSNPNWLKNLSKQKIIFIDSYSELTDQKFTNIKNGWSFYCNYSDVDHGVEFTKEFECHGLLDLETMLDNYKIFINFLLNKNPEILIILFLFPTILDSREKFNKRGLKIKNVYQTLSQEFQNVKLIEVKDQFIVKSDEDDFPYHFNNDTYQKFSSELSKFIHK